MKVSHGIIFVVFIGSVVCQSSNDLDVNDIEKKLKDIPGIDEIDTSKFNSTNLPKAEDVENVLREKCKTNGAESAVDELQEQQEKLKICIEQYINFTRVQKELDKAKKTGSMDEVFGKYCKKWPSMYACFDNVTSIARSCMNDNEKKAFNKTVDILLELQEFVCFKDGDRIAMFVAEGGVQCVQERKEGVQSCLNATLGARIPESDDLSIATLPSFLFTPKDCQDFDTVRECVNVELEKCKDSTPANIVDAFFKFLKKHMPCEGAVAGEQKERSNSPGGSSLITSSALLVMSAFFYLRIHQSFFTSG